MLIYTDAYFIFFSFCIELLLKSCMFHKLINNQLKSNYQLSILLSANLPAKKFKVFLCQKFYIHSSEKFLTMGLVFRKARCLLLVIFVSSALTRGETEKDIFPVVIDNNLTVENLGDEIRKVRKSYFTKSSIYIIKISLKPIMLWSLLRTLPKKDKGN
uniref:Uncharacterized protein n=1 Tax=Rhizophagus irregularis (strain DAOM 181602 / DAOM 197198 / MUCL 43194) TaxID=747089 RepID=U9UCD0_RHIID